MTGVQTCALPIFQLLLCTPEQLDHEKVLSVANRYLGPCPSLPADWTPLDGASDPFENFRHRPSPEEVWQFGSFRIQ